jgi:lipopolysaccharide export system permease protein
VRLSSRFWTFLEVIPNCAVVVVLLFGAIGVGLWMIIGGIVVEPPAALMEAINRSNARLARLFGRPATA